LLKSRRELRALPEYERMQYIARYMWVSLAGGIAFGLEVAFIEGFRTIGVLLVAMGVLAVPCPIWLALRARRLRRQAP
jgi:hypothetical protein